jgi:hypothetical protein
MDLIKKLAPPPFAKGLDTPHPPRSKSIPGPGFKIQIYPRTLRVSKQDRNFFLSPINIALLRIGTSTFNWSSIGTGAMFSPPAVMISSKTNNGLQIHPLIRFICIAGFH